MNNKNINIENIPAVQRDWEIQFDNEFCNLIYEIHCTHDGVEGHQVVSDSKYLKQFIQSQISQAHNSAIDQAVECLADELLEIDEDDLDDEYQEYAESYNEALDNGIKILTTLKTSDRSEE